MDKRVLAKIEPAEAITEMISLAGNGVRYVAHAECLNDLLCISFFEADRLMKGCRQPSFRTFFDKTDYITQDLRSSKRKWLTGRIDGVLHIWWWMIENDKPQQIAMDSMETIRLLDEWFPDDGSGRLWLSRIYNWQTDVLDARRKERYEKELRETEELMKLVPELPAGFEHWAEYTGMRQFNVIPYNYTSKRQVPAWCPICCRNIGLDRRETDVARGIKLKCPHCGSEGTLLPLGADFYPHRHEQHWVAIIQRTEEDCFWIRYFRADLHHEKKSLCWPARSFWMHENIRIRYLRDDHGDWHTQAFEYGHYRKQGKARWIPYDEQSDTNKAFLYTDNLPEALSGTPWQYCAVDLFQQKMGDKEIHLPDYIRDFPQKPFLEYLVKGGLVNLAQSITSWYGSSRAGINADGKSMPEILGLSKENYRILVVLNGGSEELRLLKGMQSKGIQAKPEEIARFIEVFGGDLSLIEILSSHREQVSVARFTDYILKQVGDKQTRLRKSLYGTMRESKRLETYSEARKRAIRDRVTDWTDYIRCAKQLKYDLNDRYYLLPKDLTDAHNRAVIEVEKINNQARKEEQKREDARIRKIVESLGEIKALEMRGKHLMIVLPKDGSDLRHEGSMLHHCVGTYAQRVARGETMILFVREVSHPDVPLYTMEWKDGKIAQLRGKHNSNPPKKVWAFARAFEQKMREEEEACRKNASGSTTNRAS